MCCLFGMVDYGGFFSYRQKNRMLRALARASEVRGTDAAGIAYCANGGIQIEKRPVPGHKLKPRVPVQARAVMGHTRMTTQGSEKKNRNNHPFFGEAGDMPFALAHNGVIRNDKLLRRKHHLPKTEIETDSYVAVQLLEKSGALTMQSLAGMAEQMEGSFTFTILDGQEDLTFIKGDNPLCIYHYAKAGVYLYASTEGVLLDALEQICPSLGRPAQVTLDCGEILTLRADGGQDKGEFDAGNLSYFPCSFMLDPPALGWHYPKRTATQREYIRILKSIASFYGYTSELVDSMLEVGCSTDEIEEMIYYGRI